MTSLTDLPDRLHAERGWSALELAEVLTGPQAHGPREVHTALQAWGGLGAVDPQGWTPMMAVLTLAGPSHPVELDDLIATMLDLGVSPHPMARDGTTALLAAAAQGLEAVVVRLLDAGVKPFNPRHQQAHPLGTTPLHDAARVSAPTVQHLLNAGADPSVHNREGDQPLMLAVWAGRADVVAVLLNGGADPACAARDGTTPLHAAATVDPEVTRLLLAHGAPVHALQRDGASPLHQLVRARPSTSNPYRARVRRAELLLDAGSNVSAFDAHGQTPLHGLLAQTTLEWRLMTSLVRRGADLMLTAPGFTRSPGDWLHHRCVVDPFSRNPADERRFEKLLELFELVRSANAATQDNGPAPSTRPRRRL